MKKIFNNSKSVFNAAMLTAVVVATSLFTSCSKESTSQVNLPITETTKPTEAKTPATAKVVTTWNVSKGVTDHYQLEVTATDANGKELKEATGGKAVENSLTDLGLYTYTPTYEVSTFPNEITVKFGLKLKDDQSKKYQADSKLSEDVLMMFKYEAVAYTASNSKIGEPTAKVYNKKMNSTTSSTFEDYQKNVQAAITETHLDKTFKFKFDAKGQVTVEEVQ